MRNRGIRFALLVIVSSLASAAPAQVGILPKHVFTLQRAADSKFHVGDVWEYRTRPGEEASRLTIVRIDESPELGVIVHIAVDHIRLANCHSGEGPTSIPHMPFARKLVEASETKRVASEQLLPDFEGGYSDWKTAYEGTTAGIYAIPVADAIDVAEHTYRVGVGCDSVSEKTNASSWREIAYHY